MDKTLQDYKPNPSVIQSFQVDETLSDSDLTFDLLRKLVLARKTQDILYLAMGKILKVIRDRKLYKLLDFEDFTQFLASEEISFGREKAYMYIRIYEHYSEFLELGEDVMKDFPINRLSLMIPVLKKMPEKEDQIKELERIKSLRHNDFIREVKTNMNIDGKPDIYWSEETGKWIISYFPNMSTLVSIGDFINEKS